MNSIQELAEALRLKGYTLGLANGCFDMLHEGHRHLLSEGKRHCDILIVALNDDESVKRLKGEGRPVKNLQDRMHAVMETEIAGVVVPFGSEEELQELAAQIKPDVLIKGAEYQGVPVTGADEILASGGKVLFVPRLEGHSTTEIVGRLQ